MRQEATCSLLFFIKSIKGGAVLQLTKRQDQIVHIVKEEGPITGKAIAAKLDLTVLPCDLI